MQIQKYSFSVEKACRSHKSEGRELWTLTVKAGELPRGLKYGPNARFAKLNTKAAKEMLDTLRRDPQSFIFKNNGMMVIADAIRVNGERVELTCREAETEDDGPAHGVLNGGHTYLVLEHALDSEDPDFDRVRDSATVMMTVGLGIDDGEIARISRARNTSQTVPLHALRELNGDWTALKKHLPAASIPLVAFKLNDPNAEEAEYDATDLVRRLALLNNKLFPAQLGKHPVQAYTGIGMLVKQYRQEDFLEIAPLLSDAIGLEDRVVRTWDQLRGKGPDRIAIGQASGVSIEPRVLLSGWRAPITLPDPFVLPVIAAFRVFIANGKWATDLDELWDRFGERTIRALWDAYKEQGKSSAAVFGRAKGSWAATCDLTKSAAIQMGLVKID